jgi:hypothetical protein
MYIRINLVFFWAAAIIIWAVFVTFFNLNIKASFLAVGIMPFVFNGSFVLMGLML